jgi:hypothetical protein
VKDPTSVLLAALLSKIRRRRRRQGRWQGPRAGRHHPVEDRKTAQSVGLPAVTAISSNDTGITKSGIGAGALIITDDAGQHSAGINRDVVTGKDTSGRIGNNFDLNATLTVLSVTTAFTASVTATDVFNRQLHPDERKFIDKKAKELAAQTCRTADERCATMAQR